MNTNHSQLASIARIGLLLAVCVTACRLAGCARSAPYSAELDLAEPLTLESLEDDDFRGDAGSGIRQANFEYAEPSESPAKLGKVEKLYAIAHAQLESPTDGIIDDFYAAAEASWIALSDRTQNHSRTQLDRLTKIHHSSLASFLRFAEEYGRRDATRGIRVLTARGETWIPLRFHGFSWHPDDFSDLLVVGSGEDKTLEHHYRREGWGVPLVVLRRSPQNERFFPHISSFSATAVAHLPPVQATNVSSDRQSLVIDLFEPRTHENWVDDQLQSRPLAADHTAPFSWQARNKSDDRILGFRQPDLNDSSGQLFLLEPYQRGKIPVVFVHGLLSDPTTWLQLVNELNSDPSFHDRFQVLGFKYPTGKNFLGSAADFRRELNSLFATLWNDYRDPALLHTVLIGHSMGGILSRFQVTYSDQEMWKAFATVPEEQIRMARSYRRLVDQAFFFEPSAYVERVVFIGTPHRGSLIAAQYPVQLAGKLVKRRFQDEYARLRSVNGDLLVDSYQDRIPTSTDLLVPNNSILNALNRLEYSPRVKLHSIIGTGQFMIGLGPSDGAVPVSSAQIPGVESELMVEAKHSGMQHHEDTVAEVNRILDEHWSKFTQQYGDPRSKR